MSRAPGWDPHQYGRFEAERDRPAQDLIARLPSDLDPRLVWDLGCGTGRHAAGFARRWPDADVHGLDLDPAMLAACRARPEPVSWVQGDVGAWAAPRPVDLIFANASLHWAPDHDALFPRLAASLAPGGVLAAQMPLRAEPLHHRVVAAVAADGPWAERLRDVPQPADPLSPQGYHGLLSPLCPAPDVWTTTYLHALSGPDPVLEWLKGAGLRPHLAALADAPELSSAFLTALSRALADAFPPRSDGVVLLPFPRLFLVARRG